MVGAVLRTVVVIVVLVGLAAFFIGYRAARPDPQPAAIGTSGTIDAPEASRPVDPGNARDVGADIGERVASGVNDAERLAASAALTSKIKSKMVLDDLVEAARIDVDTVGSVVTLSGSVRSEAEHGRALQLARETDGVTSVVDRLQIR